MKNRNNMKVKERSVEEEMRDDMKSGAHKTSCSLPHILTHNDTVGNDRLDLCSLLFPALLGRDSNQDLTPCHKLGRDMRYDGWMSGVIAHGRKDKGRERRTLGCECG